MTHKSIIYALTTLCPGAVWTLRGDSLNGLEWADPVISRPTDDEILALIATYVPPLTLEERIAALEAK